MTEQDVNNTKDSQSKEDNSEHYNLYTEHIVRNSGEKAKRLIKKGLVLLALAILFGLIAGLVMIIVNHIGSSFVDKKEAQLTSENATTLPEETTRIPETEIITETETESETHGDVTISVEDTEPEETITEETDGETVEESTEDISLITEQAELLRSVTEAVNRTLVTVTVSTENVDWFSTTYQNITQESGLVIENKESGCYILTDYDLVRNASDIQVTFRDGSTMEGMLMAGDATTGLAVLTTEMATEEQACVATLANVSNLSQGDPIVAVGKLYGFAGGIGYGYVTSTANCVSDTDSYYQLINTDINGTENSAGVIANLKGEVVGMITTSYNSGNNSLITAYAASGISRLIQNLSNSYQTPYFGIKGQDVTDEIHEANDLPYGIYVAAVESSSPAYKAGLQTGDILIGMDGKTVTTMEAFREILYEHVPGDTLTVTVSRKGREAYKEIEFSVVLSIE